MARMNIKTGSCVTAASSKLFFTSEDWEMKGLTLKRRAIIDRLIKDIQRIGT